MTDDERDKVDSEVQEFIQTCAEQIKRVQKLVQDNDYEG